MKNVELTNFRDKIRSTDTFKSLGGVAKKITLARNNVAHINYGYTVAKNIGYKKWEKEFNYNNRNKLIIKNILDNDKK